MKNLIALFLAIFILFSGCDSKNKSAGVSNAVISDTEILAMNITEVSSTAIAVELVNDSYCEIGYGEYFWIEFKDDGEWHILAPKDNENFTFIDILYILEKNSSGTWGYVFDYMYGELPEGEYRLVKEFTVFSGKDDSGENITLAAQFKIG